jgi:hypothetical protein
MVILFAFTYDTDTKQVILSGNVNLEQATVILQNVLKSKMDNADKHPAEIVIEAGEKAG